MNSSMDFLKLRKGPFKNDVIPKMVLLERLPTWQFDFGDLEEIKKVNFPRLAASRRPGQPKIEASLQKGRTVWFSLRNSCIFLSEIKGIFYTIIGLFMSKLGNFQEGILSNKWAAITLIMNFLISIIEKSLE